MSNGLNLKSPAMLPLNKNWSCLLKTLLIFFCNGTLRLFLYTKVFPASVYLIPWRPEECVKRPETRVPVDCELPCGCSESNAGPLEGQSVLSTAEPSFQFLRLFRVHQKWNKNKPPVWLCMVVHACLSTWEVEAGRREPPLATWNRLRGYTVWNWPPNSSPQIPMLWIHS